MRTLSGLRTGLLVAVTTLAMVVGIGVSPAFASPSVVVSVNTFNRDQSNGALTFDVSVDTTDITGYECSWSCSMSLEARDVSGNWTTLASNAGMTGASSHYSFTGTQGWTAIAFDAVRGRLSSTSSPDTLSSVVAVSDFVRAQSLAVTVNSFNRDQSNAQLSWDVSVETAALPGSLCSSSCQLQVVAEDVDGYVVVLAETNLTSSYFFQKSLSGSFWSWDELARVQVRYGSASSPWVEVDDSVRTQSMVLTLSTFTRNSTSAELSWAGSVESSAIPSSACSSWGCQIEIIGQDAQGNDYFLGQKQLISLYRQEAAVSGSYFEWVDLVRVQARYGSVSSNWVEVEDEVRTQNLSLVVNSFARDQGSGQLTWDVSIEASAIPSSACGFGCRIQLVGKDVDGFDHVLKETELLGNYHYEKELSGVLDEWSAIIELQVRYGSVSSDWVEVDDYVRSASVALAVKKFFRDPLTGNLDWSVDVITSALKWSYCPTYNCKVQLFAKDQYGSDVLLGEVNLFRSYSDVYHLTGTYTGVAKLVNLQGRFGEIESDWISNSESVTGGHDLDQVAAMLAAFVGAGVAPTLACTMVFPIGTHVAHSSLTDQDITCRSALAVTGTTLKQAIMAALKNAAPAYIASVLVTVGAASAPTTGTSYGGTLPSGCVWALMEISCTDGATTTVTRPDDAPPVFDETYEDNLVNESGHNDPVPPAVPVEGPLVAIAATAAAIRLEQLRTCVAQVSRIDPATGVPFASVIGLTPEDCTKRNVFFVGQDLPEPTAHDAAAIAAHPEQMLLTYVKTSGVGAEKTTSRGNWSSYAECASLAPDQDCDEYPFFSTEEGYPTAIPDLLPVNSAQNQAQGTPLRLFYRACGLATFPRYSDERKFLVVPVAFPLTVGVCGE